MSGLSRSEQRQLEAAMAASKDEGGKKGKGKEPKVESAKKKPAAKVPFPLSSMHARQRHACPQSVLRSQ